jgi:hypothetical protein
MEPEGPWPCSQEPTTSPYPEPDKSNAHPPTLFPISLYIILPSMLSTSEWSFPLSLFSQNFVRISHLTHAHYIPPPPPQSHLPWHDYANIWWKVQIIKVLIVQFPPPSCHFILLRSKYSPENHVLTHSKSLYFTPINATFNSYYRFIQKRSFNLGGQHRP